ncbi:MAG TPA: YdcF family protein [Gemmatimonadaceae bacterium]|nr:YdcF family protein [Gemmatimonadaceae bacterium]
METSPALDKRERVHFGPSIYDGGNSAASDRASRKERAGNAVLGFVLGAAIWITAARLGAPHIFGVGTAGWEIPFGVIGLLVAFTRFRAWLLWIAFGLVATLIIVSMTGVAMGPARDLVRSDPVPPSADAVVVLSAGVTADGLIPSQGSDRLLKALELVERRVAPVLVVSRERRFIGKKQVTSVADQDRLIAMFSVPEVVSTGWARSTRDEALYVAAIARRRGWKRVVVVTSPFHSRRACATFEKAGMAVSCVPAESRDIPVRALVMPEDRVAAFAMLIYEMAGTLRYRERGWI